MAKKYEKIIKEHIDKAIQEYLSDPESKIPTNTSYYILADGEKFPSKDILRRAYRLAYGEEPGGNFHGGKDGAHKFFIDRNWYECIPSSINEDVPKMDNVWIIPSDKTYFDVGEEFIEKDFVSWTKTKSLNHVKRGDIVYIYISGKVQAIQWRCIVGEPHYYLAGNDEEAEKVRSLVENEEFWNGPFVELIPEYEFEFPEMLSYKELKNHGLKSKIVGPQHLEVEVFEYISEVEKIDSDDIERENYLNNIPLDELKVLANKRSSEIAIKSIVTTQTYHRDKAVSNYAKRIANGICQLCEKPAPFIDRDGQPYLQTHHIKWLSRGGADSIKNTVALCPNCHQRMHVLDDPDDVSKLLSKIKKLLVLK